MKAVPKVEDSVQISDAGGLLQDTDFCLAEDIINSSKPILVSPLSRHAIPIDPTISEPTLYWSTENRSKVTQVSFSRNGLWRAARNSNSGRPSEWIHMGGYADLGRIESGQCKGSYILSTIILAYAHFDGYPANPELKPLRLDHYCKTLSGKPESDSDPMIPVPPPKDAAYRFENGMVIESSWVGIYVLAADKTNWVNNEAHPERIPQIFIKLV